LRVGIIRNTGYLPANGHLAAGGIIALQTGGVRSKRGPGWGGAVENSSDAACEPMPGARPRPNGRWSSFARVLRRLIGALAAPRETGRFLVGLLREAYETALRCERSAGKGGGRLRLDGRAMRRRIARGIAEALTDKPSPRYAVSLRKAPLTGRPRLLHIIPNVFVGGSTQLVVDLHEHLGHAYDMEVLTAALPPGGPHRGMRIHRLGLDEPTDRFGGIIDAVAPDFVHVHYWGSTDDCWYAPAFQAVLARGIPVIQNVNTPVAPFKDSRIAATVCVSRYVRDTFAAGLENVSVIHPGIDLDRFALRSPPPADAGDTVVMVYRLDRDKLDADCLDGAIEAVRLRPQTRFIIVGEGPLLPILAARVRRAGCRANFDFRGAVPYRELAGLYAQARVFLAPVARESFGQVVPFAMAMGLAVVGNRVGALPEILGSAETLGRDATETGALLARILDDEAMLARLGQANRERARAFSIEAMIDGYAALYAEVAGGGAAR
jgi:glycosyltransferase involved in cell wall biosynthesis